MQSDINGAPKPSERLDYSVNETPYDTTAPVPTTLPTALKARSVSQIEKVEKENLEFLFLNHATEGGFEVSLASFKAAAGQRAASSSAALSATYQFCIDLNEVHNPRERMMQLYMKKNPEVTIKSNVHPVVLAVKYVFDEDPKRASWYARALRYALYMCVAPANFVEFVRENQGIDGCASKYAQHIREAKCATTDTPKSAAKSKSTIICSADVLEILKMYINPESKRGTYITVFEEDGDNIVISSIELA